MSYEVRLTDHAAADLDELYSYIAKYDSPQSAESVLTRIDDAFISLSRQPHRGVYPPELAEIGVRDYREIFFKPYRMIYRVIGKIVYVYIVADGRRDMQTLLKRRLFAA
jgi:toxin ParE1/3/4